MMARLLEIIFLFFLVQDTAQRQNTKPPFWDDIQSLKRQDSISFPGVSKILFVGSYSLLDLLRYQYDIISQPNQIAVYCGENDIAASGKVAGKMVFERFARLIYVI
jgi:hypothetical protein